MFDSSLEKQLSRLCSSCINYVLVYKDPGRLRLTCVVK
jgi:hypothetical protein